MLYAKISTDKTVTFGPVLAADGTMSSGALAYTDAKIFKNGTDGALDASATFTHKYEGVYALLLKAADLNAVGCYEVVLNKSPLSAAPVKITVLAANVYDWLFGTTAPSTLTQTQVSGGAYDLTNATYVAALKSALGTVPAQLANVAHGGAAASLNLAGGTALGATTMGTLTQTGAVSWGATTFASVVVSGTTTLSGNVTLSGTLGTGAVTFASHAITGAYSVGTTTTYTGAVSYGSTEAHTGAITANITGTVSGNSTHTAANVVTAMGTGTFLTAIPWNVSWDAEVQSECTDALNAYDAPTNTEMVAAFTEIKGATWATTDTLEAIRDRGDAAWVTGTATSTLTAGQVRTELATELGRIDVAVSSRGTGTSTHSAADVVTAMGTGTFLTAIPWNAAWDTEVQSECTDALTAAALTAAGIADAVWDELATGHIDTGKAGAQLWTVINTLSSGSAINVTTTTTIIESE